MGILGNITQKFKGSAPAVVTEDMVRKALSSVMDPDLHKNIVELGFVRNVVIEANKVSLDVNLTTPACPVKDQLQAEAAARILEIPGITEADVNMTAVSSSPAPKASAEVASSLAQVKNIIAVAAGKGGVGKSTSSVNLAYALRKSGAKVGIMDADIYGPSLSLMTKAKVPHTTDGQLLVPIETDGIKMVSMAMFTEKNQAQMLRGPMAANVVKQFLTQVIWGELDYLIIDYPPGTGDIQMTISQVANVSGAVIVTTPQEVALADVRKAIAMFETMKVPVLGVVETMSYFVCDGCDKKHYIFQQKGGKKIAEQFGVPLLGEIPLDPKVVASGDQGEPILKEGSVETVAAKAFEEAAGSLAREMSILNHGRSAALESFSLNWK